MILGTLRARVTWKQVAFGSGIDALRLGVTSNVVFVQASRSRHEEKENNTPENPVVVQAAASMVTEMTPFRFLDFFSRPSTNAAKMLRFCPSRACW
jgi:hypothetical protein